MYISDIMLKIVAEQSPQKVKELIQKELERMNTVAAYRSVRIDVDVDPV